MNEVEQQTATKKRTQLGVRLLIYALLVGIAAAFYFGMNSIEQWDVSSGRSRIVTTVIGIPVWFGEPRPTTVSEWLGLPEGKEAWIGVRGPQIKGAKVTTCVMSLLAVLHRMELTLQFSASNGGLDSMYSKKHIARLVLDELQRTESICRVYDHAHEFGERLNHDYYGEEKTLTAEALRSLWNNAQLNKEDSL